MIEEGATTTPHSYEHDKENLLVRMRRIEGQAKGVQRMLEEGRYCLDVVQQLNALSSAANEVALLVLEDHLRGCVSNAIRSDRGEDSIEELMTVLRRALRK